MVHELTTDVAGGARLSVSRRAAMGAVTLGVAATAVPSMAIAASSGEGLLEFDGHFPVALDREVEGLFVAPVGGRDLDVVVLAAGSEVPAGQVRETARRLAGQGCFTVAPRLSADSASHAGEVAALTTALARMAHTSGRVRVVSV